MCMCTYIYMCKCTFAHIYTCKHEHMNIRKRVLISMHLYAHVHMYIHSCKNQMWHIHTSKPNDSIFKDPIWYIPTRMQTHKMLSYYTQYLFSCLQHACVSVFVTFFSCMSVCVCVDIFLCVALCACVCAREQNLFPCLQ